VIGIVAVANTLFIARAAPAICLVRNLRTTRSVTVTVVAWALCHYLLLGWFFPFACTAFQELGRSPVYG
jgi:hypothetical protein